MVKKKLLEVGAVPGEKNCADLGTKILAVKRLGEMKLACGILDLSRMESTKVCQMGETTVAKVSASRDPCRTIVPSTSIKPTLRHLTLAILAVLGEAKEVNESSATTVTIDVTGLSSLFLYAFLALCLMAIGYYIGRGQRPDVVVKTSRSTRTVSIQSQCSYTWWRKQPRFVPLPDRYAGVDEVAFRIMPLSSATDQDEAMEDGPRLRARRHLVEAISGASSSAEQLPSGRMHCKCACRCQNYHYETWICCDCKRRVGRCCIGIQPPGDEEHGSLCHRCTWK